MRCILQDRTGIVWIGTHGGLNRYDGSSFYIYSNLSTPALTNSVITALLEDKDGYIWIGTENGLNMLHPVANTLTHLVHDNLQRTSLPAGPVRDLQLMADGSIWVLSDRWVARFRNRRSFTLVTIDPLLVQNDMVLAGLTPHNKNEVWIYYLDQPTTLARRAVNKGHERMYDVLYKAPDYAKVYVDTGGVAWGVSCTGINRFDNINRRFEPWLVNEYAPRRSIDARYDTMEGMMSHMRDHVYSVLGPADIEFARKVVEYFAPKRTYNEPLTAKEQQVIAAMVDGLSYKMIAARLGITLETVRQHIKNIYRKLHVNSKSEVIVKSLRGEI